MPVNIGTKKWPKPPTRGGLPVEDPYVRQVFGANVPADVAGDPSWIGFAKQNPAEFVARLAAMRGESKSNDTSLVQQIPTMSIDLLLALRRAELDSADPRDEVLLAIRQALGGD